MTFAQEQGPHAAACKLSICISTFNRAAFIGETLESIIAHATDDCEVVVLDASSNDEPGRVIAQYIPRFARLRYVRQIGNNGIDRDYDRAVELARGEYCWLMSDDDLLKPAALATVLQALQQDLSLLIVDLECKDMSMTTTLQHSLFGARAKRMYGPGEMDQLFVDTCDQLGILPCVIIKRSLWLARDRARYYGSLFVHIGVIFQAPLPGNALITAQPLVNYRAGNAHTFTAQAFELVMFKWPSLVWSLAVSESAKEKICKAEPWRRFWPLLKYRAAGFYSVTEYQRLIRPRLRLHREALVPRLVAGIPGVLTNVIMLLFYSFAGSQRRMWRQQLKESPFYPGNLWAFRRALHNG